MHIGFVTSEYVTSKKKEGGLATYIRKTARHLTHNGHQVSVFFLSNENKHWKDGTIDIYQVKLIHVHYRLARLRYLGLGLRIQAQLASMQRVARRVMAIHAEHPIDILHTANYKAPAFFLRNNGEIPLVCRLSSYAPMLAASTGKPRNFRQYLEHWFELRQIVDADAAFAPSQYLASLFERIEGHPISVIRTPLEILPPQSWRTDFYDRHLQDRRYLLFVGNMNRRKGVDILAGISQRLLQQYPDLHLVMIGRNDNYNAQQKMLDYVYEQVGTYKDRLIYSPPIDKRDLFPVFSHALGLLMPSRDDNYPNVCLEAQSALLPVVGTTESSLEEMIEDGLTGFLAKNCDADSFLAAIERLLALSPAERDTMRGYIETLNFRRVQSNVVNDLVEFYKHIIADFMQKREKHGN